MQDIERAKAFPRLPILMKQFGFTAYEGVLILTAENIRDFLR